MCRRSISSGRTNTRCLYVGTLLGCLLGHSSSLLIKHFLLGLDIEHETVLLEQAGYQSITYCQSSRILSRTPLVLINMATCLAHLQLKLTHRLLNPDSLLVGLYLHLHQSIFSLSDVLLPLLDGGFALLKCYFDYGSRIGCIQLHHYHSRALSRLGCEGSRRQ